MQPKTPRFGLLTHFLKILMIIGGVSFLSEKKVRFNITFSILLFEQYFSLNNYITCLLFKGLVQVLEEQYPDTIHKFYLRHLYVNFKKNFGGGTLLRDSMIGATKASNYEEY